MANLTQFLANTYPIDLKESTYKFQKKWFDFAKGLFHKRLRYHTGCVNSLEFGSNGEFLFSGQFCFDIYPLTKIYLPKGRSTLGFLQIGFNDILAYYGNFRRG